MSTIDAAISFLATPAGATIILAIVTVIATILNVFFLWSNERNYRKHLHLESLKSGCLSILDGNILSGATLFIGGVVSFDSGMFSYVDDPPEKKWWDVFTISNTIQEVKKGDQFDFLRINPSLYRDLTNHFPILASKLSEFEQSVRNETRNIFRILNETRKKVYSELDLPEDYDWRYVSSVQNFANNQELQDAQQRYRIAQFSILRLIEMNLSWEDFTTLINSGFLPLNEKESYKIKFIFKNFSHDESLKDAISRYERLLDLHNQILGLIKESLVQVTLVGKCGFLKGSSA